jgi:hypothetical protein
MIIYVDNIDDLLGLLGLAAAVSGDIDIAFGN